MSDEFAKLILQFDDAGAEDDELAKGVRVGHIRIWFDEMERRGLGLEILKAVNHTLNMHGKVDANTPLHQRIDDFLWHT